MTNVPFVRSFRGHKWLPINHWSLLRTLQIPLFQIPTTSEDQNFFKNSQKPSPIPLYGIWKKIREMKRALIFVVKTEIHEKNLSKRKATGLPMAIGTCSACYQYPLVTTQHCDLTSFFMEFSNLPEKPMKFESSRLISRI